MKTRVTLILVTLLCAAVASVPSARAATITVTNTNDSGAGSLRQALADASDGDTINFAVTTPATITLTSGELLVDKTVTISGPTAGHLAVSGNAASRVFHIVAGEGFTISNLTITNGVASGPDYYSNVGGGIFNDIYNSSALTVTNCTISGNSAGDRGGGIANYAPFVLRPFIITNCTISGNSAGSGGGIFNEGTVCVISNSTISGNSAGGFGGGIYHDECESYYYNEGSLTITNSTLSDNSAPGGGGNIGGVCFGAGGITIGNTILNNAATGGNIYAPNHCCPERVYSRGYNMIDDDGGGFLTGPGDQIYTAALLGPLQDNGGPTFTHALLCGSPAIDAGNPSFTPPPDYDQRGPGYPRVVNSRIDIGAFEVQGTSNAYTGQVQPPINADGSSVFTVRRGVVPVKFTLADCDGHPTCTLPPATIAVTRTAGGVVGQVNESVYSGPADSGSNFRIAGCEYQYNLYSNALGVGTYRVDILTSGQAVGSATFKLK